MNEDNLLSADELSKHLGLHVKTIRIMHNEGRIRGYKIGNRLRFDLKEVRDDIRTENYKRKHKQL